MKSHAKQWHVYMIQTKAGKLYTGIAVDVVKRFKQHAAGKGAKFFYMDPPEKIVWQETCKDRSDASRKEVAMKKRSHKMKMKIIRDGYPANDDAPID